MPIAVMETKEPQLGAGDPAMLPPMQSRHGD